MKIQIFADDDEIIDTIEDVHTNLKSQHGIAKLTDKLIHIYKNKYSLLMYERYKKDRRSSEDRRHSSAERRNS